MSLPNPSWPTHNTPRISLAKFTSILKSKNSPAVPEASAVFAVLIDNGVDPSFALAQFRVESQYGTAGYAKETGSWGNMLYDRNLTKLSGTPITKVTSSGAHYTYATYSNYVDAVTDYCRYLAWYRDEYGLDDIYGATARWLGREPGSTGHENYVSIIIADMIDYEHPEGTFYESGDKLIYAGDSIGHNADGKLNGQLKLRYPINDGDTLYRGTTGDFLKKFSGKSGTAWFLGPVNGSWEWGAIIIGTSVADPEGTIVYIKNPDKTKVVRV